jgi:broad specificity phosphatase PhoE
VWAALTRARRRLQALDEIHAGIFDGMTYEQIEEQQPEEFRARKSDKLRYRCAQAPAPPVPRAAAPRLRRARGAGWRALERRPTKACRQAQAC